MADPTTRDIRRYARQPRSAGTSPTPRRTGRSARGQAAAGAWEAIAHAWALVADAGGCCGRGSALRGGGEASRGKGLAELLDGFGAHAVQLAEVCLAYFGEPVQGRVSGRGEGSLCWLGESCGKVSLLGLMVLGLRCRRPPHPQIPAQRARIGELLGQLRDTQREHDSDAAGRLAAENSTLNSGSATSQPATAPLKNACRPPGPTTASSTSASPTWKRSG